MISGRPGAVVFTINRFRSARIFSLITPYQAFSSGVEPSRVANHHAPCLADKALLLIPRRIRALRISGNRFHRALQLVDGE